MSTIAILLLLVSAATHATWNFFGKRENPSAAFFLVANTLGSLVFLPIIVAHLSAIGHFPTVVYQWLVLAGLFQAVYYIGLAGAYRSGDMSVAYPLARSLPVLVVTAVTLFLGRGSSMGVVCLLGILMVVIGCLLIPMRRANDFHLKNYLSATCLLAMVAAAGTAGYSLVDDEALRVLRNTPQLSMDVVSISLAYGCLEGLFTSLWMVFYVLGIQSERRSLVGILRAKKCTSALTGVVIFLTYGIVLISMAFVENVSFVVVFRQFSILVGTAFGIVLLKEPAHKPKLFGAVILVVGLIIVGSH